MGKSSKLEAVVFPNQKEFELQVGSVTFNSRQYSNSSNAYRGCRSAIRNLLRNQNVTNESNYGEDVLALTNDNGYVIASTSYAGARGAAKAVNTVLDKTKAVKKIELVAKS